MKISENKNKQAIKKPCKKATGRPRVSIDYDLAAQLATIHCNDAEIAAVLGCSISTLQHDQKYIQVRNDARNKGKASLRRMAYTRAGSSDRLLEFLLKNYVGLVDKHQVDATSSDGSLSPARADLRKLPLHVLKALQDACPDTPGD